MYDASDYLCLEGLGRTLTYLPAFRDFCGSSGEPHEGHGASQIARLEMASKRKRGRAEWPREFKALGFKA